MKNNSLKQHEMEAWFEQFKYAQSRQNTSSDGYVSAQFHLASIAIAFVGIVLTVYSGELNLLEKVLLFSSIVLMFWSLISGVLNYHMKESFWNNVTGEYLNIYQLHKENLKGVLTDEQMERGIKNTTDNKVNKTSGKTYWILQSVFLSLAIILLLIALYEISFK